MVPSSLVGSTAGTEQALVLLLIIAAAVAVLARRIGVPYIIGLVLVGLVVGLVLHWDSLRLSSDLVFYVFLPILLFESGYKLEATLLRDQWRRIAALAVPGVLVAFVPHRRRRASAGWPRLVDRAAVRRVDRRHRPGQRGRAVPQTRRVGTSHDARRRREPVQRRRGRGALRRRPRGGRRRPRLLPRLGRRLVPLDGARRHRRGPRRRLRCLLDPPAAGRPSHRDHALDDRRLRLVPACPGARHVRRRGLRDGGDHPRQPGPQPHHEPRDQGDAHDGLGLCGVRRQLADLPAHRPERAPGPDPRASRDSC